MRNWVTDKRGILEKEEGKNIPRSQKKKGGAISEHSGAEKAERGGKNNKDLKRMRELSVRGGEKVKTRVRNQRSLLSTPT